MRMICCGVVYSTQDPSTYWCIQKYIIKDLIKPFVGIDRVSREVVYTLLCKKNACTKLEILRYGTSDEKHLLEREALSGKKAMSFLRKTAAIRVAQQQKCPVQVVPTSKRIPYVYGRAINSQTQRIRYLNEEGWAPGGVMHCPITTYKL